MQFKNTSDELLLIQLKALVAKEREVLSEIIFHLIEVEYRKLHLTEGFSSLFEYAVKALGYSEAQAYRRISAMRILKEVPSVIKPIKNGSLNLTHLTQAREYFKSEQKKNQPLSVEAKETLLVSLANKSTRETEKIFAELSPESITKDKERVIGANLTEIRFVASDALLEKLKRFKELDSHVQANPQYAELFERLVDLALRQKDIISKPGRSTRACSSKTKLSRIKLVRPKPSHKPSRPHSQSEAEGFSAPKEGNPVESVLRHSAPKRSRWVPVFVKRIVFGRDQYSCSYENPKTGKRCGSRHRLQIDHRMPYAKYGSHSISNLRVLCQSHNLLEAERVFGKEKIGNKAQCQNSFRH